MEPTNKQRAVWGGAAVRAGDPDFGQNEMKTSVSDALANVMHLCQTAGVNFTSALRVAENHFRAEQEEN